MSKKYNIKTLHDMIDCTNGENIDDFLYDLKAFILVRHLVNTVAKNKAGNIDQNIEFTWIDDGNHKIDIILNDGRKD